MEDTTDLFLSLRFSSALSHSIMIAGLKGRYVVDIL